MKRKQIGMLIFLAVIVILLFVTANTSGVITDPENYQCGVYATVFALLPPVIAIGLALITKEVYTSLLAGIITGGLLYSNFNSFRKTGVWCINLRTLGMWVSLYF